MKTTAIDDILEAYDKLNLFDLKKYIDNERGRLKEKEKKQIENAYVSGLAHEFGCMEDDKYYDSTFKQSL